MEYFLQCSICLNNYDDKQHTPRQLPCQHNVCSECLPNIYKRVGHQDEHLECHICRREAYQKPNEIPKSLVLMQLIDATRQLATSNAGGGAALSTLPPPAASSTSTTHSAQRRDQPTPTSHSNNNNHFDSTCSSGSNSGNSTSRDAAPVAWNVENYLRDVFRKMDKNGDGSITAVELQQALRSTQASEFSMKTVQLLISKYDANGDREISFSEFHDLYLNLNDEFEAFLMMDADGSGSIDKSELMSSISRKGYHFSPAFYDTICDNVRRRTGHASIEFDNYIRIAARFDFLCSTYQRTPYFHKEKLEVYLTKTFFQDFW